MNLLEELLNAQGGGAVRQMAQNFNLDEGQTQSAIGALLPALTGAMRNQATQGGGGLESLLSGLTSNSAGGGLEQFLNDPGNLATPQAVDEGNNILGQLLGSKDVSRAVANQASAQTGIGADVLKQMLPLVATLATGMLSQRSNFGQSMGASAGLGGTQGAGGLMSMLDFNGDGNAMDDILGMASKFLRK